jgi:hypothetical protein
MTTAIKLKRSETAASVPTTSDLAVGEVAVNTADQKIYVRDSANNIVVVGDVSSASSTSLTWGVTQSSHGFSVGDAIYFDGSTETYELAQADDATTLGAFIVSAVANTNTFTVCQNGKIDGLSGLTAGQYYFVSTTTAGEITSNQPTSGYDNPIFFALSETEGIVLPYRPAAIDDTASTLAVSEGGTGATTAAGARTNLDVYSTAEVNAQSLVFSIVMG